MGIQFFGNDNNSKMIRFIAIILFFVSVSCNSQANRDGIGSFTKNNQSLALDTLSSLRLEDGFAVIHLFLKDSSNDIIQIVKGTIIIGELSLPIPDVEVKNLSVDKIEKTKTGFVLAVKWGGGKNFYGRDFYFEFNEIEKSFYLESIRKTNYTLESHIEESTQEEMNPPLRVDKIDLSKFIVNE